MTAGARTRGARARSAKGRLWAAAVVALALSTSGVLLAQQGASDAFIELLSGVDFVPARASLDEASGSSNATADLLEVVADGSGADPGVRLRAIGALALYPSDGSEAALTSLIQSHQSDSGLDTLYVRAAAASLAEIAGPDAVSTIAPLLDHASRDVRADAAHALAVTGSPLAIPILRNRLGIEASIQVRLAISAAIRDLTGATYPGQ